MQNLPHIYLLIFRIKSGYTVVENITLNSFEYEVNLFVYSFNIKYVNVSLFTSPYLFIAKIFEYDILIPQEHIFSLLHENKSTLISTLCYPKRYEHNISAEFKI